MNKDVISPCKKPIKTLLVNPIEVANWADPLANWNSYIVKLLSLSITYSMFSS